MTTTDCIFCKIIAGEIPCWEVLETDTVLAFLDIGPLAEGHVLVIPKEHHATIDRMPEEAAADCARVVVRLSRALREALGAGGWNVLQNNGRVSGQEVDHVHFHLIPRREGDGLGYRWKAGTLAEGDAKRVLEALKKSLE